MTGHTSPALQRAERRRDHVLSSQHLETTHGPIKVRGDGERISVTETRRSWNTRVGKKDVDRMNVVRVGVPAPTCHLYGRIHNWVDIFRRVTNTAEVSWCGQQIFDHVGNDVSEEDVIDVDRCNELEFKIEYDNNDMVAFAGADLHVVSKTYGWVVSLPRATQQLVQIRAEEMEEVFEKCLLESIDRDLMAEEHDMKHAPPGDWVPEDYIHLGITIYVDNVGKSSGMTPVLGKWTGFGILLIHSFVWSVSVVVSNQWNSKVDSKGKVTVETNLCVHGKGEPVVGSRRRHHESIVRRVYKA